MIRIKDFIKAKLNLSPTKKKIAKIFIGLLWEKS